MNINVNRRVSVTLTEKGADWLNEYHWKKIDEYRRVLEKFHTSENQIEKIFPTNNERGTVIECLLWELMEKFGEYFTNTTDAPFINNDINILIPEC
jgi:hypothetical protein